MVSENLLQTKGFENSVIFVNGDSISVIIGASELKKEEVAQIQNIIKREMKASIENIHISTKLKNIGLDIFRCFYVYNNTYLQILE